MEPWQKKYITKHLHELVECTICNPLLLTKLQSTNILSGADVDQIEANKERFQKSTTFHDIMKTRLNSYGILTKALFECKQSGVVKILLNGLLEFGIKIPLTYCNIAIDYQTILNTTIYFQGNCVPFSEVLKDITAKDLREITERGSLEADYIPLMLGDMNQLNLVKDTIPPQRINHIPRYVSNQLSLNPDVFKQNCKDVFVFKGIKRYMLSELAGKNGTSTSGEQITSITSRFILLEDQVDWEDLLVNAKKYGNPIHLVKVEKHKRNDSFSDDDDVMEAGENLNYSSEDDAECDESDDEDNSSYDSSEDEDNCDESDDECGITNVSTFTLEESSGESTVLSNFILKQTKQKNLYISEEKLLLKSNENNSGICICDSPGSGKSWLLENLARSTCNQHHDRVVVFVKLPQLAENLKTFKESTVTKQAAMKALIEHISPTELGRKVLEKCFTKYGMKLDLFCDAFDEVVENDVAVTLEFLKEIRYVGENVKIYVTSRTHFKKMLENTLNLITFDIFPFTKKCQQECIVKYWKKELELSNSEYDEERLYEFGNRCLDKLNEIIHQRDRDIMGIPLQCHILANVYKGEAQMYSNPKRARPNSLPTSKTVHEMYQKFMDQQFGKFDNQNVSKEESELIKRVHVWAALKLAFFKVAEQYYIQVGKNAALPLSECLSVGILEKHDGENASFIHLSFAEFLIAEYIRDILIGIYDFDETEVEFIHSFLRRIFSSSYYLGYSCPLSSLEKSSSIFSDSDMIFTDLQLHSFRFPVIMYFLNGFFKTLPNNPMAVSDTFLIMFSSNFTGVELYQLLQSCAIIGYDHLLDFLQFTLTKLKPQDRTIYRTYLMENSVMDDFAFKIFACACNSSGKKTCDVICRLLQECFSCNIISYCIDMPTDRYTPLHLAIQRADYSMVEYLSEKMMLDNRQLLDQCIYNSYRDNSDQLQKKLQICELLSERCNSFYTEDFLGQKIGYYFGSYGVHLDMIKHAIKNHANRLATLKFAAVGTAHYMKPGDYHHLIWYLNDRYTTLITQVLKERERYHVHHILAFARKMRLDTLEKILKLSGVDANETDLNGNNLLMAAIQGNQSVQVAKALILKGANYALKNTDGKNVLHMACDHTCFEMLKYFCSFDVPVHTKDEWGRYPIEYAVGNLKMIKLLVSKGASISVTSEMLTKQTVLHQAASKMSKRQFQELVDFLLRTNLESVFTVKDSFGHTPLHMRMRFGKKTSFCTITMILTIDGFYINDFDGNDDNLLSIAIHQREKISILKNLVEHGVNFNPCNRISGQTALHLAVRAIYLDAVSYFLTLSIDVNQRDYNGKTATYEAENILNSVQSPKLKLLMKQIIAKLTNAQVNHF